MSVMRDAIITVEGLGKRYRLGASRSSERYTALRDVISEKAASFFEKLKPEKLKTRNGSSDLSVSESQNVSVSRPSDDFWALKDVNFAQQDCGIRLCFMIKAVRKIQGSLRPDKAAQRKTISSGLVLAKDLQYRFGSVRRFHPKES